MNYSNIKYYCTTNAEGFSVSVYVSGCNLHCDGCFNRIAWDKTYGKEFTQEVLDRVLDECAKPYISALSILGGEPLWEGVNLEGVEKMVDAFKEKFGNEKKIWLWSGYCLKNMSEAQKKVVLKCNYLIDGRFEKDKWDSSLIYRGSTNQNVYRIENNEIININNEL